MPLASIGRRGSVPRVPPTVLLSITGLGKTVLLLVAGTFIAWAVISAIFVPKRSPGFPRDLNLYVTLTAVLFAVQMGAVWWVTGTQEVEEAEAAEVTGDDGRRDVASATDDRDRDRDDRGAATTETGSPTETETTTGETTETTTGGTTETASTETTGRRHGRPGCGEAGLRDRRLHELPHAGGRWVERERRPEPRRREPVVRQGRGARHERAGRDAAVQGSALRAADRRRRGVRLVRHRASSAASIVGVDGRLWPGRRIRLYGQSMCGICGIVQVAGRPAATSWRLDVLDRMTDVMTHRGPRRPRHVHRIRGSRSAFVGYR